MKENVNHTPVKHFEDGSRTFHVRPHSGTYGAGVREAVEGLGKRVVKVKTATGTKSASKAPARSA
jgi:hypothetical protein